MCILETFQIASVIQFFPVATHIASHGFVKHFQGKL